MYADRRSVTLVCEPMREYFMFVWAVPCEGACWHVWRHDVGKGGSANIEGFLRDASNIVCTLEGVGGGHLSVSGVGSHRVAHPSVGIIKETVDCMPCHVTELEWNSVRFNSKGIYERAVLTAQLLIIKPTQRHKCKTMWPSEFQHIKLCDCVSRLAWPLLREC